MPNKLQQMYMVCMVYLYTPNLRNSASGLTPSQKLRSRNFQSHLLLREKINVENNFLGFLIPCGVSQS